MFENDVEMYGAQAWCDLFQIFTQFENDVEMYGAQATVLIRASDIAFENDVEMYGAQADFRVNIQEHRLRMMQKCMVLKQSCY